MSSRTAWVCSKFQASPELPSDTVLLSQGRKGGKEGGERERQGRERKKRSALNLLTLRNLGKRKAIVLGDFVKKTTNLGEEETF